ncbi:SpoVG family protein [Oscillibacter valericigenes]|uniref:SpoVG family protein n=1 Tax=Oscillibacter valericigenes TaxID=351091 RepID=UPI00195E2BF3|nr:SpoVG family protein [Oscillibacter valericigenes]MBM6910862.1 septation protein SpoVG family protein [Oscillibacter valericigenes]
MRQNNDRQPPNYEQLPMQINVKIYRPSVKGPILADASVNLNGCFAVRGVQIKEGKNGPFVSMPSRQVRGEYRDICFPCTPEFKQTFDQAVLDAYRMELDQGLSRHHNEAPEPSGPAMDGMTM